MAAMSAPVRPRPHRRAVHQLLLGLLPLVLISAVLLTVQTVRLADTRRTLDAATAVARAEVVATGRAPGGRGVVVTLDAGGTTRRGLLVLADRADVASVPVGTELAVQYDPADPPRATAVYLDGDAAHRRVQNLLFGDLLVAVLLVVALVVTGLRLLTRPRLRRAPAAQATASRVVVRQGLLVRSWLELVTARGIRWLPVHWSPELARLAPGTPIELRGNPNGRLALPVVDGAELWPSGRLRASAPRGSRQVVDPAPETADTGWGRQVRADLVPLVAAPALGLLWSYVDGSGPGGFVVATAVLAALLFWLPQLLGSDPAPTDR
jgi:hypothetical protein